ncbi:FecR family protein [Maribellus maritimus]|uniref:FecR family protein n=1 Tax=Maribellus maritimus TaxID=2870838 RepID=UPI001EEB6F98|nr:FecR domain-containing protein [Maribellus maritimus]MCG6186177.1 DUF4974 domain-containing protein [Maribellus maritimus]
MDFNPEILHRYFKGTYSKKDYRNVKTVFEDKSYRPKLKEHLEEHWNSYFNEPLPENNIDHLLYKLKRQIQLEEKTKQKSRFTTVFQRIAAILVIPLVLSVLTLLYLQKNKNGADTAYAEIQCPLGVRTKFELPDGSTGFLNSGSNLRFPVSFSGERHVSVTGEAFFNIVPDQSNPFIVRTQNLNIKVLGTRFNVIAYREDKKEEVILNSGKVEILSPEGKVYDTLKPNQIFTLNTQNKTVQKNNAEALQYIGWTEGKLIFRHEKMRQVSERLGRWYNAEIIIEDPEILDYVLRATFIDEPLDEVLKLLSLTAPITFEEKPRETTNDNTYKKRKVILKLDKKRQSAFK